MTIEIKDGTMFSCMWFVEGSDRDWMAAVFKPAGEPWQGTYRFRYYKDDKSHDSDDEKNWYSVTTKSTDAATERKLCKVMDQVATMTQEQFALPGGKIHKLVLKTDRAEEVIKAMKREKWAHMKEDTVAEAVRDHMKML